MPSVQTLSSATASANWLGVATLFKREVWRFLKVWNQTLFAPVVTVLLFLAILMLALGGSKKMVGDISYDRFIAPGLIMMAVVQNAFANTSSSLMLAKIQGVIIDILMPPLKGWEVTLALVSGGVVRGALVGVTVSTAVYFIVPHSLEHPILAITYVLLASIMLSLLGMLGGIVAQGFDQLAALTNYLITPLSFLSGTFYSINNLPPFWYTVSHYNPFFFMIDGFRYAITGHADGNIQLGLIVLIGVNVVLAYAVQRLFTKGWRMKS